MLLRLVSVVAFAGIEMATQAQPVHYLYGGDKMPSESPYAAWFTTLGPGHPTGSYFVGTDWSSDGDVLTMHTQHPNDFVGASSLGIWFGRTDNYGDPSVDFSLASTVEGNRVEVRLAMGTNSSEWSLYWYDANSRGAAFYFLDNGFHIYTATSDLFVPLATMTSFHTYASHVQGDKVFYYLDGALLATGTAQLAGVSNFLLIGDGSAGSLSGFGTFRIDWLDVTVHAGPATPPAPAPIYLTDAFMRTNGAFQFAFTNIPGLQFSVQASTNIASGYWTALGAASEIAPGAFRFADVEAVGNQQRYYRVLAQ